MDIWVMIPLLWGFEERKQIIQQYDRTSGARFHAISNYFRPQGKIAKQKYKVQKKQRKPRGHSEKPV